MQTTKFERQLRGLARAANRDMLPESYELYDVLVLEPFGDEAASAALLAWVRQNQRSVFPTPGELIAILNPQASPKAISAELASRVLAAIARRGSNWAQTFHYDGHATLRDAIKNELGGAILAFVDRIGSWSEVCRQFGGNDSIATLRAQLRESLEPVVSEHANAKLLGTKTTQALGPTTPRIGGLTRANPIAAMRGQK